MKKIFLTILIVFANFVFSNTAFAENFYIENYEVNLKVNEDRSVQVTEDIDAQFTKSSHGIFRTIPYKNARISNVQVNNNYNLSYGNSELTIKIGDPDKYVYGKQHYNIQYLYTILDTNNEFYFNIIGTEWPVRIENASFTVKMPKDFDFAKTGLSIGKYGTVGFNKTAVINKERNYLYGEITQPLEPYNGMTLRIEVPKDYFTNGEKIKKAKMTTIAGIIILTLLSYALWFFFGKDAHITPVVTFYPPKDTNVMDAELIYKEKVSTNGLVALLIELAGKGYIQIKDSPADKNFSITKIKEYDGKNQIEKLFLTHLFANCASSVTFKTLSTSSTFYVRCEELLKLCSTKGSESFYESPNIAFLNSFVIGIFTLGIILFTIFSLCNYTIPQISSDLAPLILFPIIAIIVITTGKNPFLIIWGLFFGGIPAAILLSEANCSFQLSPVVCLGIAGIIISIICRKQISKKNKRGQAVMSELVGLKKFLEVAEKRRLESLVEENPSYFYDILPYAYILGVSDKWIKKFESIMNTNPDWYTGSDFNAERFHRFTSDMHSTTIPSVANGGISPRSSSSSSHGGGGHSGGGHGGGGGGSW